MGVKNLIYRGMLRAGYEIRPAWDDWRRLPGIAPTPATIIDVGVASGTPYLYDGFPDAALMLVEPIVEFGPAIRRLLAARAGSYHPVAVGAAAGQLTINVTENPERSSLHPLGGWRQDVVTEQRQIPIETLDALVAAQQPQPPYLLKIDTEGYELDVVGGAGETLTRTGCVVAEVSVASRFEGGYQFADFVTAMHERGFGFADVLTLARRHGRVTFVDAVFLPYRMLSAGL